MIFFSLRWYFNGQHPIGVNVSMKYIDTKPKQKYKEKIIYFSLNFSTNFWIKINKIYIFLLSILTEQKRTNQTCEMIYGISMEPFSIH